MNRIFLRVAAIFGGLAVVSGAFLAHELKQKMPPSAIEIYETAVRYQFYHVFALLACGILSERLTGSQIKLAGRFFILGILLFCGSLYAISALIANGLTVPLLLGILTPLGGASFIAGWIFLTVAVQGERRS